MYYVISNGCLQLLPKLFPYSSSCSVGSNHSVDSFAEIVALSNHPVITRDRATTILQFSSNDFEVRRSDGVSGCCLSTDMAKFCLVFGSGFTACFGGRVSFGGFFQRVLCLRPIHFSSPRVDWMRIEKQLTIVDPGFSVKTW